MRRRLLNQIQGDPAAEKIAADQAVLLADVARFPRLQPHLANRAERERVTKQVKTFAEIGKLMDGDENGGKGVELQGPDPGMSSRPERLPPVPAAPRPKLRLKKMGEE